MLKLVNGDCLTLLKRVKDGSVDLAFTSPPYNRKRNDKYDNYEDTKQDFYGFLVEFTDQLLRISKGHVIVNIQKNYYNKADVFRYIGNYPKLIQDIIIWEKTNPMPASGASITNAYEMFIVFGKKPLKSNTTYTKNILTTSVNSKMPKNHRAVMKQEVADWFIKKFTNEGDIILDCFMGMGTTGISCKKYRRGFVGIEIDEVYFNTAKSNIKETKRIKREKV